MWHRPSHQYWFLFWWQWALICTKAFMVAHTVFPTLSSQPAGFESPKSHQRPYKWKIQITAPLPNQGQGNLDKVTLLGTHPKFRVDPDLGRLFARFHESWVLWKNPWFSPSAWEFLLPGVPKNPIRASRLGMDRWMDVGCTAVGWMKCPHYCWYLKEIVRNEPSKSPRNVEIAARENGAVCPFVTLPSLLASFKAASSSTRAMMQHSLVFFIAYVRWNMLQDRTTWKNRHTAVFLEMILQQNTQLFFILSRRGVKFSQTSISSNPFALTIRTIYCKVSVMLSWAPQRVYVSILLSITMLDSSSSRSIALNFCRKEVQHFRSVLKVRKVRKDHWEFKMPQKGPWLSIGNLELSLILQLTIKSSL